jgi:acid phosphatase
MKLAVVLLAAAVVAAVGWRAGGSEAGTTPMPRPKIGRIAVMVLENRSYGQVIGNPSAPYINSLTRRGALATRYYAITHPSLPNYIAMTTGGHKGINGDCGTCQAEGRSLVNQLDTAHISWRAYFESLPARVTSPYTHGSAYNRHYNPFVYTELGRRDLASDVTNFGGLSRDLASRSLRRFSWIAPNVWHDGHNGTLAAVDSSAARLVPRIVSALGPRGVLFITWDEGQRSDTTGAHGRGGGHVPLIAVGPGARAGARVAVRANHYALLKTIEAGLRVGALGHARQANTPVLTGLLQP